MPISTGTTSQWAAAAMRQTLVRRAVRFSSTARVTEASVWLTPCATTPLSAQSTSTARRLTSGTGSPVSAAAIVDALREQGEHIGIATVYRQLEKLERQGSVHKVTTDEGAYYQFCTHGCASDCCLFKCERCGRIVHLDCHQLAPLYEHLEHEHGFSINPRKTMFYGLCRECQEGA